MRVADAMTRAVLTVTPGTALKDAARILVENRISGLPVVDGGGRVVGVVSETDVVACAAGYSSPLVGDAMTTPPVTIGADRPLVDAASLMIADSVNRLPVVAEDGTLLGIVTRTDLLRAFVRSDAEIAREIRDDVLMRRLWLDPHDVQIDVEDGEVTLTGTVDRHADTELIAGYVRRVTGVVAVRSRLGWVDEG
jgi:CBS domain-containing protein